jgi:hypothetical protein
MEKEADGVYGYTITLGENRWEHFQIWLDGEKQKALHPGELKAGKHARVLGPEDTLAFNTWMLDGRPLSMWKNWGAPALTNGGGEGGWDEVQVVTPDTGSVGDKYRIRLRLSGKFRTVEWEKLEEKAELAEIPKGQYYVVGSWNDLDFEEMTWEDATKSIFSLEVQMPSDAAVHFFIVRNKDWMQVFYPSAFANEDALGPEPMQMTSGTWSLRGQAGDVFKITFARQIEALGAVSQQVSWKKITAQAPLREDLISRQRLPTFHLMLGKTPGQKMNWTGNFFEFFVELGDEEHVTFLILKDGDYARAYFPSIADAAMGDKYKISGPGYPKDKSLHWTIGKEDFGGRKDSAEKGKRYQIRMLVDENGKPFKVEWSAAKKDVPLEDALIRGYFLYGQ